MQIRDGLLKSDKSRFFAQVTQKTQNQAAADAKLLLAIRQRAADAVQHGFHGNAALGMCLRVKEGFYMHHALVMAALQISPG